MGIPAVSEFGRISQATISCISSFETCLSTKALMKQGWAESRLADINLWASGVGALARPDASLDRRLQFQPKVEVVLTGLLVTLEGLVDHCRNYASKESHQESLEQYDFESTAGNEKTSVDSDSRDEDADQSASSWFDTLDTGATSDSMSSDGSDPETEQKETKFETTLRRLKEDIEDVLDQLLMLGYAIRKSGTGARLQRADTSFNPDNNEDFRAELEAFFTNASKKGQWKKEGDKETTASDRMKKAQIQDQVNKVTPEQQHLITANLRRRHRFQYAKQHQQKLDYFDIRSVVPKVRPDEGITQDRETNLPKSDNKPANEQSEPHGSGKNEDSNSRDYEPKSTMPSGTDPSMVGGDILKSSMSLQTAASHVSVSVAKMRYPSAPKLSERMRGFKCPCCFQTLPEMFQEPSRWRKHLVEDLCPYTCPFSECPEPQMLYISRQAWRNHVIEAHGAGQYWECLACVGTGTTHSFQNWEEFVNHNRTRHKDAISEEQILDLRDSCRKMAPPNIPQCPLCSWPEDEEVEPDATANLEHIGNCIHEFSLNALPWIMASQFITTNKLNELINQVRTWLDGIPDLDSIDRTYLEKVDILSFGDLGQPIPMILDMADIPEEGFVESSGKPSKGEQGSTSFDADLPEVTGTSSNKDSETASIASNDVDHLELRKKINSFLVANSDGRPFLPADKIDSLTRSGILASVLKAMPITNVVLPEDEEDSLDFSDPLDNQDNLDFDDLLSFISGPGKRSFLTLTYCRRPELIRGLFESKFEDSRLPIRIDKEGGDLENPGKYAGVYTWSEHLETLLGNPWTCFDSWDAEVRENFAEIQWLFLAPVFRQAQFSYSIDWRRPLPYLSSDAIHNPERPIGSTAKIRIHDAHLISSSGWHERTMCLTCLPIYWENNLYLSNGIQLNHKHLERTVAIYRREGLICVISPWASGRNLRQLWERGIDYRTQLAPSFDFIFWALEQMTGLADALRTIHEQNIRHGNLKPENILWFEQQGTPAVLQIAHIGCAIPPGQQSIQHTSSAWVGSRRYQPPDTVYTIDPTDPRSTRDDIWSIGCIYLELLIWLLDGKSGLDQFHRLGSDRAFWEIRDSECVVSLHAQAWMEEATVRLKLDVTRGSGALADLLLLIRTDLLVISPRRRAYSSDLYQDLLRICNNMEDTYQSFYGSKMGGKEEDLMFTEAKLLPLKPVSKPTSRHEFGIAIICTLPLEYDAVLFIFDEIWDEGGDPYGSEVEDDNSYKTGRIGNHNVVLTIMRSSDIGSGRMSNMKRSYSSLKLAFHVGICGTTGRNTQGDEILLGDVIMDHRITQFVTYGESYLIKWVAQLDAIRGGDQLQQRTAHHLRKFQEVSERRRTSYRYPGAGQDKLYEPTYLHKHNASPTCICRDSNNRSDLVCPDALDATCEQLGCSDKHLVSRKRVGGQNIGVHRGTIVWRDLIMIESGGNRDRISRESGAIAFDLKATEFRNQIPAFVIRGAYDYADGHNQKNMEWREYAAATAASATKAILEQLQPFEPLVAHFPN
ncbi:hypothetical protein BGZ63DRAFT_404887 [Mariannaea sp. PMI_226]|nr:hypothetical protein BGZ63DRAFT_404887 [Mariannaea sp. PMI_226]